MQIIIKNHQKIIPVNKRATKAAVLKTLKILRAKLTGELTIVYVDDRTIQGLNYKFRGQRRPTDVLCFDLTEGEGFSADIVISTETAYKNSRFFKTSPLKEANLYLIHGVLHLFGFNDKRIKDRIRMQRKAVSILNKIYG